jgi:integrase
VAASFIVQEIIERSTDVSALKPSPACTLKWFWEQRYRPFNWKVSSAPKTIYFINRYIVEPFAEAALTELNRFQLQKHLNGMLKKYSRSVILNFRTYAKAILDEAIEQQYLDRNPAGRLELSKTRKPSRRALAVEEIAQLLDSIERSRSSDRPYVFGAAPVRPIRATKRRSGWPESDPY